MTQFSPVSDLFALCRAGYEATLASEITAQAEKLGIIGCCESLPDSAWLRFTPKNPLDLARLIKELNYVDIIFCRQWFIGHILQTRLSPPDRLSPIRLGLEQLGVTLHRELFWEHPDNSTGGTLAGLLRSLGNALRAKPPSCLENSATEYRGHILFLDETHAAVGFSLLDNMSPWENGIPRLHLPRSTPSRSAYKLEEAFLVLLGEELRELYLKPEMTAVDLGAAPGGWSWLMAKNHIRVTAVDHGRLDAVVLDTGLVQHESADAFTFRPRQTIDWLLCDVVDKPARTLQLIEKWLSQKWCRHALFNLKLPMKHPYFFVEEGLQRLANKLRADNISFRCRAKQLYHDRQEITVLVLTGSMERTPQQIK